jgi:hypothetical protein
MKVKRLDEVQVKSKVHIPLLRAALCLGGYGNKCVKVRSDHVVGSIVQRGKRLASCLDPNPDLFELLFRSRVGLKEQSIGFGCALRVSDTSMSAVPPKAGSILPAIWRRRS